MTEPHLPGRALVSRRAVREIVARAVSGSYGVTGLGSGPLDRLRGALGLGTPGIRLRTEPGLELDLYLTVAFGVPVAEVAHNVERAVRYAVRQGIGRELDEVRIHVGGLRLRPAERPHHATRRTHGSDQGLTGATPAEGERAGAQPTSGATDAEIRR